MKRICVVLLALVAGVAFNGCKKKQAPPTPQASNAPASASGNPITAPVDYLGAIAHAQKSMVKTIDTTSLNEAIKTFYAMEERYPNTLGELVTREYLPQLPQPPPGMKFEYNPKLGEVKVVPK